MTHKLALAHFFSVFFDGSSRCRWLISAQILELVNVTIVSPSTSGAEVDLALLRPRGWLGGWLKVL